ncbi:hypothetical protein RDABS01_009299 [Bienertia sinuspersici]
MVYPTEVADLADNIVKFESKQSSASYFLVLKDEIDGDKKTVIPIFSPMTGAFADKWETDHYPPHLKKWVTWSSKPQFGVTFLHIPLYWEWTEDIIGRCKTTLMKTDLIDAVYASMFLYKCNSPLMQRFCEFWCPTTNTVLTGDGEAFISLWDLRILRGLPIYGAFYDEVIPTALELEGSQDGEQFLPASCKYMFTALQSIMSTSRRSHVTFEEWCRFWFRAPKGYSTTILPKAVENFSHFGIPESWSNKHEALTLLNVPEEHRQQTYLAAFLSCWLCAFVLPLKNLGCISPSVFKPASQLASGQRISLAIPVLASIYRGLNEISRSLTPADHAAIFLLIMSMLGQLSIFVATVCPFMILQDINWIGNCMRNPKDRLLIDDSTLRQDVDFLLSIRSCFLTLRYDNDLVVESYSPHRFSRQFGFCQNIPGALKPDSEEPSLQYLWSLFQTSTQVGTKSSFIIPASGMNNEIRSRTTAPFKLWWKTFYSSPEPSPSPPLVVSSQKRKVDNDSDTKADSSDKGESKLQKSSSQSSREPSPQRGKEGQENASSQFPDERTIFHDIFGEDEAKLGEKQKGDQAEDVFDYVKELEIMGNAFAFNNPNVKELEHTTASIDPNVLVAASDHVAMYAAATIIARADRCEARFLAQQMRAKLLQTPLSNIPALDPELKELFGLITSKNIDVTSLREHVGAYVSHASSFQALDSSENVHPSLSSLEERLTDVESRLSDVVNSKRKEEEQIKLQQAEILKIEQRCDELQKELKLLEQKKSELSSALASSEDSLGKHDAAVTELIVSHSSIEEEITATREATTKRKKAEENFQNARTALESLHWEP